MEELAVATQSPRGGELTCQEQRLGELQAFVNKICVPLQEMKIQLEASNLIRSTDELFLATEDAGTESEDNERLLRYRYDEESMLPTEKLLKRRAQKALLSSVKNICCLVSEVPAIQSSATSLKSISGSSDSTSS